MAISTGRLIQAKLKGKRFGELMAYVPKRGDAVWLDFNPQAGHEQVGRRPALVISPLSYNKKVGLALLCPITSQIKGYPFEVIIPSGYKIAGAILSDQVKSLDWKSRNASRICVFDEMVVEAVMRKLGVLLQV
jgi:mRNA interferase MazF